MGHFSGVGSWNFGFSLEYLGTVHAVHAVDIGRRLMNIDVVSIISRSFSLSLSNLSCCSVLRISVLNRTARCQFHFSNFLSYWYVSYLIFVCSTFSTQSSEWCLKLKNQTHSSYIGLIVSNEHVIDVKECQSWSTFNDIGLDLGC